jgi:hypothetical protein
MKPAGRGTGKSAIYSCPSVRQPSATGVLSKIIVSGVFSVNLKRFMLELAALFRFRIIPFPNQTCSYV